MAASYEHKLKGHEGELKNDLVLLGESPTAEKWGIEHPGIGFHDYCTRLLGRRPDYVTKFAQADAAKLAHYIVADLLGVLEAQRQEIARLQGELAETHKIHSLEQRRIKDSSFKLMQALSEAKV